MKNKFMRIAAVALMLCLVTTCAISGTFAKYTTEGTATDTARVAKWGITVTAPTDEAFAKKYNDTASESGVKVVSTTEVVAPGTNGTLPTPVIAGTAEVAVEVIVSATITLDKWTTDGTDEYCPIEFTVGEKTYGIYGTEGANYVKCTDVADLKNKVETAISATISYDANATIAAIAVPTWAWAFTTGDANDAKDTKLGARAADDNAPTITYSITVTVNQVTNPQQT